MKTLDLIEEAIHDQGLKKKAVAEAAGITQQQFCDILHGRRKIKVQELIKIARFLGLDMNELIDEKLN